MYVYGACLFLCLLLINSIVSCLLPDIKCSPGVAGVMRMGLSFSPNKTIVLCMVPQDRRI